MTDRNLDADVAVKVMNWSVELIVGPLDSFEEWRDDKGWRYGPQPPRYSTEIQFAWSVVDHLVAQGAYVLVEGPANGLVHNGWRCAITPRRDLSAEVEEWAETAPEAICRAALSALGQAVVR